MTPKEKAEELYKRMYTRHSNIYPSTAIECALIAVDEIIKEFENIFSIFTDKNSPRLIYWQEVKEELEKL